MPYIGQAPKKGDENNFKILDNISSYTLTFDGSDSAVVSAANDTITSLSHRFVQGQRVTYNKGGGTVITGLSDGVYYIIKHDHNTIKLATSASNAANGTAVNITNVGSGSSHTLNVAFDGVNTKFKATHTNGQKAKITRSAQLVISMNGVIQQPHDTATPSTGFGFDLDGTIVFSQAPASSDVYWAHVLTNNNVTFDISDNHIDRFTGNASTTAFNLSKSPPDNRNVLVTIDGVVQYPNDPDGTVRSYNVVENVLTFTTAPAAGTEIQVRHIGFAGSSSGGSGGVTNFYGRTGAVVLKNTDNITVNDAAITGNATITGNLTVDGTTTTLDTVLTEVDKLEVGANNTTVGVAVTQSGSGDLIRLYDGTSQVVTVDDEGKVGIGSMTPGRALTIQNSEPRIRLQKPNQGHGEIYIDDDNSINLSADSSSSVGSSSIIFRTNGAEKVRIKENKVGIGTDNPLTALDIYATPIESATINTTNSTQLGLWVRARTPSNTTGNIYTGITLGEGRTGLYAYDDGGGAAHGMGFWTGSNSGVSEKLRITSGGNVGIGTVTPGSLLNLASSNPVIRLTDTDSNVYSAIGGEGGNLYLYTNSSGRDFIFRGTVEVARITGDGMLGIGTHTPGEALHLGDNKKIALGYNQVLELHHNGSSSSISNSAGILNIVGAVGQKIDIKDGAAYYIRCNSTNSVELFYNGGSKFSTKDYGATLNGNMRVTTGGSGYTFINDADTGMHNPSDGKLHFKVNGVNRLSMNTSGISTFHNQRLHIEGAGSGNTPLTINTDVASNNSVNPLIEAYSDNASYKARIGLVRDGSSGALGWAFFNSNAGSTEEALRINSYGQVGVNTTSPGSQFGIAVDSGNTNALATGGIALALKNTNTTDNSWVCMDFNNSVGGIVGRIGAQFKDTSDKDTDLYFATRADGGVLSERLRIDSAGRCIVGGGTHAGGSALVVKGGNQNTYSTIGMFSNHTNPADNTLLTQIRFGSNVSAVGADIRAEADAAWGTNDYPTRLGFYTAPDGSNSRLERLRITKDGQIRIDQATSANNGIRMRPGGWNYDFRIGAVSSSGANIWLGQNYEPTSGTRDSASYGTNYLRFTTNGEIMFGTGSADTNPTERLKITNAGKVGINETNPQTTLNVRGTISTGRNVAREVGTATASNSFNTSRDGENVLNGKKNYENGGNDWLTQGYSRDNAYVTIDLGANYNISRAVIYNQNEYVNSRRECKGFTLEASTDNSNWTTVISDELGMSNGHEPNPGWSFRIPSIFNDDNEYYTARYWKFTMLTFHSSDPYGGIMEIELYEHSDPVIDEITSASVVAGDVYAETAAFRRITKDGGQKVIMDSSGSNGVDAGISIGQDGANSFLALGQVGESGLPMITKTYRINSPGNGASATHVLMEATSSTNSIVMNGTLTIFPGRAGYNQQRGYLVYAINYSAYSGSLYGFIRQLHRLNGSGNDITSGTAMEGYSDIKVVRSGLKVQLEVTSSTAAVGRIQMIFQGQLLDHRHNY